LRGDYADDLILDEWQLMNEDAWGLVGAPMLLDNDGDATFIYTPRSFHSRSVSKATDPLHASKLFKQAAADTTGRWETFHFTSHENPHISEVALREIARDMTKLAYRMEIGAEDIDEVPGALWLRATLDETRASDHPAPYRIVVAIDPHATSGQAGIIIAGIAKQSGDVHGYTLDDVTLPAGSSVADVCLAAVAAYHKWSADILVGEVNNGGDWIENAIRNVDGGQNVNYKTIRATRGKYTRAEPVAAIFEQGRGHMVGFFPDLEDELCSWVPGDNSPNRLDAMVWAYTELMLEGKEYAKPGVKSYV
jgi:phage terminase large subunit-like protein